MPLLLPLSSLRCSPYSSHPADMNRIFIPAFELVHGKLPDECSTLAEWEQASSSLSLVIWGSYRLPGATLRQLSIGTALCSARRVIRLFRFERPDDLRPCQALDLVERCITDPDCWEAAGGAAITRNAALAARSARYTATRIAAEIAYSLVDAFSRPDFVAATDWCAEGCAALSRAQSAFTEAHYERRAPQWAADDENMRQRADFIRILAGIDSTYDGQEGS